MKEIKFRAWHHRENRMYFRGYQKWFHVLLCDDDAGVNGFRGKPVKRASYGDCSLMESTGLLDKNHKEVYEGDVLKLVYQGRTYSGVVGDVPDTFGSKAAHPLTRLLARLGLPAQPSMLEIEVLGNEYENPELAEEALACTG